MYHANHVSICIFAPLNLWQQVIVLAQLVCQLIKYLSANCIDHFFWNPTAVTTHFDAWEAKNMILGFCIAFSSSLDSSTVIQHFLFFCLGHVLLFCSKLNSIKPWYSFSFQKSCFSNNLSIYFLCFNPINMIWDRILAGKKKSNFNILSNYSTYIAWITKLSFHG